MGHTNTTIPREAVYEDFEQFLSGIGNKATGTIPLNSSETVRKLDRVLKTASPQYRAILARRWKSQYDALTYREIEAAILQGHISQAYVDQWTREYADTVNNSIVPQWKVASAAGYSTIARGLTNIGAGADYAPVALRMNKWFDSHGAELVKEVTAQQTAAINSTIQHYTVVNPINPRDAARFIRPVIGLTERQALAVSRRRDAIYKELVKEMSPARATKLAEGKALRYRNRLVRYRAEVIARTEQAKAFNQGSHNGILESIRSGKLVGKVEKRWYTGLDERVCSGCGPLHDTVVQLDEEFTTEFGVRTKTVLSAGIPPLHPQCRCVIIYVHESFA